MTTALEAALDALMVAVATANPDLPGIAAAVTAPALGLTWEAGVDGALARDDGTLPAARPFRIASITKPFTATTIHALAEEGSLGISAAIAGLIAPETATTLVQGGYDPDAITVAHLLSHTSGIFDHTDAPSYLPTVFASPARRWTRAEQIDVAMREGRPHGQPGEVYRYSDTGYVILGEIVERARGTSLAAAARAAAGFERLGMTRTWWEGAEPAPGDAPALAHQYAGAVRASEIDASFDAFGGGGIVSTVGDLVRFLRALIGGVVLPPRRLSGALATPPARSIAGDPPAWRTHGYLLATMPAGRHWALGHTGAWGSAVLHVPALDATLALTLNREGQSAMTVLHATIARLTALLEAAMSARRG
ncbi:MAG: beta-lactamase family protein [Alphaproteobacteria bacterium]|nr:beta-lactamase family protein [Alphaproteobacteria bacterium]